MLEEDLGIGWKVNALVLLVTSSLSFFASCMLVLCCLKYSKGSGISNIVFYLGVADIGWSLLGVVTFSVLMIEHTFFDYNLCVWSRLIYQFFASASVMWSAAVSAVLYQKFRTPKKQPEPYLSFAQKEHRKSMIFYHCVGWGIPLAQNFATYPFIEEIPKQHFCLPRQPFFGLLWFLPITCAIIVCIMVYACFLRVVWNPDYYHLNIARRVPFRVSLYILVMCLCWIPDIVYYCVEWISVHNYVIAIIINGLLELQGLLDCIAYGLVNKDFRGHFAGFRGFCRALFSPILVPVFVVHAIYLTCNKSSCTSGEKREVKAGLVQQHNDNKEVLYA